MQEKKFLFLLWIWSSCAPELLKYQDAANSMILTYKVDGKKRYLMRLQKEIKGFCKNKPSVLVYDYAVKPFTRETDMSEVVALNDRAGRHPLDKSSILTKDSSSWFQAKVRCSQLSLPKPARTLP